MGPLNERQKNAYKSKGKKSGKFLCKNQNKDENSDDDEDIFASVTSFSVFNYTGSETSFNKKSR